MAKSTAIKTVKIILELSEEEAEFLRDITQNQLVDIETKQHKSCRESIFKALVSALKGGDTND